MKNQNVLEQFIKFINGMGSSLDERPMYQITEKDVHFEGRAYVYIIDGGKKRTYKYTPYYKAVGGKELFEFEHWSTKRI